MPRFLTRTIWILSLVSLFADLASEMLHPVMPLFLAGIGMNAAGIGFLEGAAALLAGFGKAWFGSLSDQLQRRNLFIRLGYGLSAFAKPVMGLFPALWPVFTARLADRIGKGMRGGARDAVLAGEAAPENRGKVFGFHRSMDTFGALLGAGFAWLWLYHRPGEYAALFLVAFLPGLLSIGLTLFLPREGKRPPQARKIPYQGIFPFWKTAPSPYKLLLVGGLAFAFLNSSDLLLLLRAGDAGRSPTSVLELYLLYNLVYALASFPLGGLADRIGFKPVYLGAVLLHGICYFWIGTADAPWAHWFIFALYGCFAAANEGIVTAWLTHFIPRDRKATGLGLYAFFETFAKFVASPLLGLLWVWTDSASAFQAIGIAAAVLALGLAVLLPARKAPATEGDRESPILG
ncbi:MAG: hypothetical protein RLZZ165_1883, partial [Bacteroidota bacterium]